MNFYIQLNPSSYSASLLLSCSTCSCSSFTCFSSSAICSAASVYRNPFPFGLTSGEQRRAIMPFGLPTVSFSIRLIEALFWASVDSIWCLVLASSSCLSSRMALSLSRLLRLSWLISSCSTRMRLFCGLMGWQWLSMMPAASSSSSLEVSSRGCWWVWEGECEWPSSRSRSHCEHSLELSSSLLIQQIMNLLQALARLQSHEYPGAHPPQADRRRQVPAAGHRANADGAHRGERGPEPGGEGGGEQDLQEPEHDLQAEREGGEGGGEGRARLPGGAGRPLLRQAHQQLHAHHQLREAARGQPEAPPAGRPPRPPRPPLRSRLQDRVHHLQHRQEERDAAGDPAGLQAQGRQQRSHLLQPGAVLAAAGEGGRRDEAGLRDRAACAVIGGLLVWRFTLYQFECRQMLCTYCKKQFDEKLNIPRLLILCGHSLCESCCYRLHLNNRVECPECRACTFIESISLLPKNLALIARHSSSELCAKHHKKYEAFCHKENLLICIECILQDGHKNHEMDSIRNSFEAIRGKWEAKMEKIAKYAERLEEVLQENKRNQEDFEDSYRNTTEVVASFFKEMREIISKEEQSLQSRFRELYTQNTSKYSEKSESLSRLIEGVQININNFNRYENLNDIEFLESFSSRENMYASINQTAEESVKAPNFMYSKKGIVEAISKNLQALICERQQRNEKKTSAVNINNYGSNFSSTSGQFKKGSEAPIIKAVRKAAVPPPSNINLSNKKKVSTKKDISTPITVQNTPSVSGKSNSNSSSAKEKIEAKCNSIINQIKSDISAVDPKESLCHSFMSNMTSFLGERKSIYLLGGFNEEANNVIKLNLFSWQWEEVCQLPTNRSKFGCIAVDQQLYLFGGKKGKERVNDSEVYSISNNKWARFEPMGRNRSGFAIVHIGHLLYFIGGNDGESILCSVETLNLTTGEWRKIQSMNEPRDELAVVVGKNNRIYAIGGFGGINNEPLKSVEVYDPKTEKWKMLPSMNEPRRALSAAVLADGIYAIGGFDGTNYMSSVQKFQEGEREWSYVGPMKQARCTHSAVSIFESQEIFVFGGFDFVPLDSVEKYNVISNDWETVCKMPTPRFMHSSLLLKED